MKRLRRAAHALATVWGTKPRGYFIPDRFAAASRPDYRWVAALFAARRERFAAVIRLIDAYAAELADIGRAPPPGPRWDQDWFPRLDAAALYAMTRNERPARAVEIGSGHSTRFLARAVADGKLATEIVCIDPAPRASLTGLAIERITTTLQAADLAPIDRLGAGDLLFVDSSHVLMPGSDVDVILNGILPRLAAGVLIHVHDVFLPEPYPTAWRWRGYNEQLAIAALLGSGTYEPLFASAYTARTLGPEIAASILARLPLVPGALESSLWLRKSRSTPC
ncbi:MAG: class I SAM-dependent methyltransferase [Alphaproteobacteria bacterium]|nr:class I SAM-dependent methyltransferase [Alphaproteobacteria bacterium]